MTNSNHYYGAGPRVLEASDLWEGVTIAELADWITYLRADGAPDDAPVRVRTNVRAGLKRVEVLTGKRLADSLQRRAQNHNDQR